MWARAPLLVAAGTGAVSGGYGGKCLQDCDPAKHLHNQVECGGSASQAHGKSKCVDFVCLKMGRARLHSCPLSDVRCLGGAAAAKRAMVALTVLKNLPCAPSVLYSVGPAKAQTASLGPSFPDMVLHQSLAYGEWKP
jgi:hypothetical protein